MREKANDGVVTVVWTWFKKAYVKPLSGVGQIRSATTPAVV